MRPVEQHLVADASLARDLAESLHDRVLPAAHVFHEVILRVGNWEL
jgi:hypothetical protein